MGVKLKDIIQPEQIDFKDLKGRAISIDAFNTLYQFLSTIRQRDGRPLSDSNGNITSHLSGILYRNSSMIEKDIKPIYVFDGTPSYLKQETIDQRRQTREESEKKWKEALAKQDTQEARKYAMRSSKLSPYIIESSKKLLTMMGIPYIEAYGEGEAQAAYLVENGDAWAVASQDYDCLLFGAKRVVRNLAINSNLGDLEYYNLKRVLDELDINRKEALAKQDTQEARKYAMRSSKLSPYIIESSKKLLTMMGIPYIEAYGEGEAQAAYLVENGDAWAVASQDYDCLLFGAKRVVRNLAINSNLGDLEYYNLKRVLDELDINREQLIDMGILIGTDFSEGLKGVGAKTALKLAKKGELENKLAKLQEESSHDISEVREIFLNHNVNTDYKIRWKKPAKNDIIDFLCEEHGFSQDRVSKACDKLKNLNSSQKSLEDWF